MIAHAILLFVSGVVLLIDNDKAEVRIGQKQCRARTDDHACFAGCHRVPGALAPARCKRGVPFGRTHPEPGAETIQELRGKRDLREQHQRLAAFAHNLRDRFEIDLGLARSRHAVDQRHAVAALGHARAQLVCRRALCAVKIRSHKIGIGQSCHRLRRQYQALQRAFIDQTIDDRRRNRGGLRDLALCARKGVGKKREHAFARGGHARRRRTRKPHADALARGPEMLTHAQGHAQHHAPRRQRVAGDPINEPAQFCLERRDVELVLDLSHAVVQAGLDLDPVGPDHTDRRARPQRHADQVPRREIEIARHAVGIGMVERDRHEHIDKARDSGRHRRGVAHVVARPDVVVPHIFRDAPRMCLRCVDPLQAQARGQSNAVALRFPQQKATAARPFRARNPLRGLSGGRGANWSLPMFARFSYRLHDLATALHDGTFGGPIKTNRSHIISISVAPVIPDMLFAG